MTPEGTSALVGWLRAPLLDLEANTWEVNATVVRVPRVGLIVQPRPKTAAGWRVVAVPDFATALVRSRLNGVDGVVFTAPLAKTVRDPSNASADLRQLLDSFECDVCAEESRPDRASLSLESAATRNAATC